MKPSLISSAVRIPSWSVSNSLKMASSLSSFYFVFMLFAMYARTAYCNLRSQWKFLRAVKALAHSGFTVVGELLLDLFLSPGFTSAAGPCPLWKPLIQTSLRASAAVTRFAGTFYSIFLMRSFAVLLTQDHSLPIFYNVK